MSSLSITEDTDLFSAGNRELCQTVRTVLDKVADKWTIMILTVLETRPYRFNEIRRRLGEITHKALADALKRLERDGLVTRTVLPTRPIGVEYRLTPLGTSLQQPFAALQLWAIGNAQALSEARATYDSQQAA